MAHMNILVNSSGQFALQIDGTSDWQFCTIGGNTVLPGSTSPYLAGPVQFYALAAHVTASNQPTPMLLSYNDGTQDCTAFAAMTYSDHSFDIYSQGKLCIMSGLLFTAPQLVTGATAGPLHFTQPHLTGTFSFA